MIYESIKYDESKDRFFRQIAKMDADLNEYIEKQGGRDGLTDGQKKNVAGREFGLNVLLALPKVADELIEILEGENEQLRRKIMQLSKAENLEKEEFYLPRKRQTDMDFVLRILQDTNRTMTFTTRLKEGKRIATIEKAINDFNI